MFLLRGEEEGGIRIVAAFKNSAGDGVKGREALVPSEELEANAAAVIQTL